MAIKDSIPLRLLSNSHWIDIPNLSEGEAYCAKDGMSLFVPTTQEEVKSLVVWFINQTSGPKPEALLGIYNV